MNGALLPALCLTAAVLAGVVAVELATGARPHVASRDAAAPVPEGPAARPTDPVPQLVAVLLARPPFAPDRKPEAVQGADDPRLPHLTGILVTSQERRAIFAGRDGGRGAVVGQGDQVGAYRVQDISATDVTLAGADGPHVVRPTFSAAPPPGPSAAPFALPLPRIPPPSVATLAALPPNPGVPPPPGAGSPR